MSRTGNANNTGNSGTLNGGQSRLRNNHHTYPQDFHHKNHNGGSNYRSRFNHENEGNNSKEKHESTNWERKGNSSNQQSNFNNALEETEPEWLDPVEASNTDISSVHSVKEFEEWKARMKANERKKAGIEETESEVDETSQSSQSTSQPTYQPHQQPTQPQVLIDETVSVDSMFGGWEGVSNSSNGNESVSVLGNQRSSRFSRFFKPEPQNSGSRVAPPPPGLGQRDSFQQLPQNASTPAVQSFSAVSPQESRANTITSTSEDDKRGFNRIMQLLNDKDGNPGELLDNPSGESSSDLHSGTLQSLSSQAALVQTPENPGSDDAFFLSLLNKNTALPTRPGSANQSQPMSPEQQQPFSPQSHSHQPHPQLSKSQPSSLSSPQLQSQLKTQSQPQPQSRLQVQSQDSRPQSPSQSPSQVQVLSRTSQVQSQAQSQAQSQHPLQSQHPHQPLPPPPPGFMGPPMMGPMPPGMFIPPQLMPHMGQGLPPPSDRNFFPQIGPHPMNRMPPPMPFYNGMPPPNMPPYGYPPGPPPPNQMGRMPGFPGMQGPPIPNMPGGLNQARNVSGGRNPVNSSQD